MQNSKKIVLICTMMGCLGSITISAEKVCERCEEIRRDNALHHKNYEYYDEYLITEEASNKPASNNSKSNPPPKKEAGSASQAKPLAEVLDTKPWQDGPSPNRYQGKDLDGPGREIDRR